jgi:DNA-binding IclR family transcriptional regulator
MAQSEPRGIQSIEVSGRILNVLLETPGAVMLKDIAARTDMAAAQVHAYLSSFKRMDLVVQDPGDGRYSLGALALRLGLAYRDSYAPLRSASETLAVVEARTGLMCALVIWSNGKPTAFEVRAGRQVLNVNLRPGMVFSVTGSPVGAIFAAFLPSDEVEPIIAEEQATDRVMPGQWQLSASEFAALRHNVTDCGFAALAGQPIAGVNSVAIPVQEPDGTLVGAILMIGNETAMDVTCGADLYAEVRAILQEKSGETPA